jgi:acyl carrier protein
VRRIVTTQLGVGPEELTVDVSLTDDLAADSLDLVELGLALEDATGLQVPESVLERVRTYGDLVRSMERLARDRLASEVRRHPAFVWARVVPARSRGSGELHRGDWLTPYSAETIVEDALRGGPGSYLEVRVPPQTGTTGLAELRERFAWLAARGIEVHVQRGLPAGQRYPDAAA